MRDNGFEPNIIEYLKNPPNIKEIKEICKILNLPAADIIRTNEKEYKQSNISLNDTDDVIINKIVRKQGSCFSSWAFPKQCLHLWASYLGYSFGR